MSRRGNGVVSSLVANTTVENHSLDLNPVVLRIEQGVANMLEVYPILSELRTTSSIPDPAVTTLVQELIVATMRKLVDDCPATRSTIVDIARALRTECHLEIPRLNERDFVNTIEHLVIAIIGWVTLLFSWHPTTQLNHCSVQGGPLPSPTLLHMENCSRSVGTFIRLFGLLPSKFTETPRADRLLYLSVLNFSCLTHVGRLRVQWVPHLTQHLVLDISTRTLQLFQYPSMCVLALCNGDYQKLSGR